MFLLLKFIGRKKKKKKSEQGTHPNTEGLKVGAETGRTVEVCIAIVHFRGTALAIRTGTLRIIRG